MLSKIQSLGCRGVTGYAVSVECHVSNGLPGFDIVGLPDAAVKEARERVRSAIKTNGMKFPVSRLTVNLIAGLDRASASANALLPAVLSRGTARYPDMEQLSAAMDTLYGATVDSIVRKKGERQCIGFAASFIDDAFTPHGEKLLEPVAALTGEMLLDPVTAEGHFLPD